MHPATLDAFQDELSSICEMEKQGMRTKEIPLRAYIAVERVLDTTRKGVSRIPKVGPAAAKAVPKNVFEAIESGKKALPVSLYGGV